MAVSFRELRAAPSALQARAARAARAARVEAPDEAQGPDACAFFEEETRRLFVDVVQRSLLGQGSAPRPVFRKLHGVASGTLRIDPDLPDRFRHGIFAHARLSAWVRFSSDTAPGRPDADNATLGIGIKLFGLGGHSLDPDDPDAGTADLLMQNHDRFFVETGRDFCEFSHAAVLGDLDAYLQAHPETQAVLAEMAKPEAGVLAATYWSVLPYRCGPEAVVKYRLQPAAPPPAGAPLPADPNYLKAGLAADLQRSEAVFELAVQAVSSEGETPIDRAMRRWPTTFRRIGTLTLARQDVSEAGQAAYGENLSFNPWRVPEANRPLGSVADSRRIAYRSAAHLRRTVNGVPAYEPARPR